MTESSVLVAKPVVVSVDALDLREPGLYLVLGQTGSGKLHAIQSYVERAYGTTRPERPERFHVISSFEGLFRPAGLPASMVMETVSASLERINSLGGGVVVVDEIEKGIDEEWKRLPAQVGEMTIGSNSRLVFTSNFGGHQARKARDAGASQEAIVEEFVAAAITGLGTEFVNACKVMVMSEPDFPGGKREPGSSLLN